MHSGTPGSEPEVPWLDESHFCFESNYLEAGMYRRVLGRTLNGRSLGNSQM